MTRSRQLRSNTTKAEEHLWQRLRNRQLRGVKFRRQVAVDRYIVDFLCEQAKVIVELDGGQHQDRTAYDDERTAALEAYGYIVLRYWNNEVLANTEGVLEDIEDAIRGTRDPSTP